MDAAASNPLAPPPSSKQPPLTHKDLAERFNHVSRLGYTYLQRFELVAARLKLSHLEAFPPPDGAPVEVWRKAYNSADTEAYKANGGDSTLSKARRADGTTRHRAEELLRDKMKKAKVGKAKKGVKDSAMSLDDDDSDKLKVAGPSSTSNIKMEPEEYFTKNRGFSGYDKNTDEDKEMEQALEDVMPGNYDPPWSDASDMDEEARNMLAGTYEPSYSKGKEKQKQGVPENTGTADALTAGSSSTPKKKVNTKKGVPKNKHTTGSDEESAESTNAWPSSKSKNKTPGQDIPSYMGGANLAGELGDISMTDYPADTVAEQESVGEESGEGEESEEDTQTYCICGGRDDHSMMIQCEKCNEWFHTRCIDPVTPREDGTMSSIYRVDGVNYRFKDIAALCQRFYCYKCHVIGEYEIVFRTPCIREGCLKAARGKIPTAKDPVKFCSPACQVWFYSDIVNKMPDDGTMSRGGILKKSELAMLVSELCTAEEFKKLGVVRPSMYKNPTAFEEARTKMVNELGEVAKAEYKLLTEGKSIKEISEAEQRLLREETDLSYDGPTAPASSSREDKKKFFLEKLSRDRAKAVPAIQVPDGFGYAESDFPWRVMFSAELQQKLLFYARQLNYVNVKIRQYGFHFQYVRMILTRSKVIQKEYAAKYPGKRFCGYDPRLCMNEWEFFRWFKTEEAIHAYEVKELADPEKSDDPNYYRGNCIRKTCGHHDWIKIEFEGLKMETDTLARLERHAVKKRDALFQNGDTKFAMRDDPARQGHATGYYF